VSVYISVDGRRQNEHGNKYRNHGRLFADSAEEMNTFVDCMNVRRGTATRSKIEVIDEQCASLCGEQVKTCLTHGAIPITSEEMDNKIGDSVNE